MAERYIKAFYDWLDNISELTDEETGRLFRALLLYAQGKKYELSGNERFVFPGLRAQIDRDKEAYQAIVDRNRSNGRKGGRPQNNPDEPRKPSGLFGNPDEPRKPRRTQDKDKDEDKDKDKDEENIGGAGGTPAPTRKRFCPPSVDEVQEYITSMGYRVCAQGFVDYYIANGWKVGKNPMKDWKAAVRNWNRKNTDSPNCSRPVMPIEQGNGANPEDWYK